MKKVFIWLNVSLLAAFTHTAVAQQICDDSVPAWTPADQFDNHGNGTVTDSRTELTWMVCEVGKSGKNCEGEAETMKWEEARALTESFEFAGHKDWRLPGIQELLSIAEDRCISPALNLAVFPNGGSATVWTAWLSDDIKGGAWFVRFSDGTPGVQFKGELSAVRFVRGGS